MPTTNHPYRSAAEQAFVRMATHPFFSDMPDASQRPNIVSLINGKDEHRFQKILIAAYTDYFESQLQSMLEQVLEGKRSFQFDVKLMTPDNLEKKKGESKEAREARKAGIRRIAVALMKKTGASWPDEVTDDKEKIKAFIALYFTSESINSWCINKPLTEMEKSYGGYGWLLKDEKDSREQSLLSEVQDELKSVASLSVDGVLSTRASQGTLGRFVLDMMNATPGTFGTWAYDTAFIASEDMSNNLENLAKAGIDINAYIERAYQYTFKNEDSLHEKWQGGPNPRFMFQFLNWGDSLSVGYPASGKINQKDYLPYGDFSGPLFGSLKRDATWTPSKPELVDGCLINKTRIKWREDKSHDTGDGDHIGKFTSAIYETPLWGAFMTDYVKGINTPGAEELAAAWGAEEQWKQIPNPLYDAMNRLLEWEVHELRDALANEKTKEKGIADEKEDIPEPILLLTSVAYGQVMAEHSRLRKAVKNADQNADSALAIKKRQLNEWVQPWQVIRWPHHSGSGAGTFKATTLAYAYGRAERALEYAEQREPDEAWPWPFEAVIGKKGSTRLISAPDTRRSLYDWLAEGYEVGHPVLLERAMGRAGNYFDASDKVVRGLLDDASDVALEAWKGNKGSKTSKVCFASVKEALFGAGGPSEWFENDDFKKGVKSELAANELAEFESWFDAQTRTRKRTVDWLCGFSGVMSGPVYPLLRDAFAGLKNSGSDNKVLDELVRKLAAYGGDAELDDQALTDLLKELLSEQGTSADEAGLRAVKLDVGQGSIKKTYEAELKKFWKELKEIAEKEGALTAQRVLDCLVRKTVFTKEDVDAAFLLGWRSEDKLVPFFKDGEWHVPDAFDKTLMPAPKDLVSVKKELGEMRKKQG